MNFNFQNDLFNEQIKKYQSLGSKFYISKEFKNQLLEDYGSYKMAYESLKDHYFRIDFIEANFLPIPLTYKACDIVTRKEIIIKTDEQIHCMILPIEGLEFTNLPPLSLCMQDYQKQLDSLNKKVIFYVK